MPEKPIEHSARAREEERYRRWQIAARNMLAIKGTTPRGPGLDLEADEWAHAFVKVANEEQEALRDENQRLREELAALRAGAVRDSGDTESHAVMAVGELGELLASAKGEVAMLRAENERLRSRLPKTEGSE